MKVAASQHAVLSGYTLSLSLPVITSLAGGMVTAAAMTTGASAEGSFRVIEA